MIEAEVLTHPVQRYDGPRQYGARVPVVVTTAAYEVYCQLWGEQKRLMEGECRGGFGVNELIALLYARPFPREQWMARFREACDGMKHL